MARYRIEDFSPRVQEQIRAQLGGVVSTHTTAGSPCHGQATPRTVRSGGAPTKTEEAYRRAYLAGVDARYEAVTFRLANGHRYTPDWIYWQDGQLHAVEVKGSYRLGSYQRARLAYDQARVEFPGVAWTWAERTKDGGWKIV